MLLVRQKQTQQYRKESFTIYQHFYHCIDSGGQFSTEDLNRVNQAQLHNQYRERCHIPFCEEIIKLRRQFGLSATRMAEVLGFGVNVYRHYENGEIPSISNARLINLCQDPQNFLQLATISGALGEKEMRKLKARIREIQQQQTADPYWQALALSAAPGRNNGFVSTKPAVVKQMFSLLAAAGQIKLQQIPLLFLLVDLSHFRNHSKGLIGMIYHRNGNSINMHNFFGLLQWACQMGCCKISYDTQGQAGLLVGNHEIEEPLQENDLAGAIHKIILQQKENDIGRFWSNMLQQAPLQELEENSPVPYELAYEMNALDEWLIWQ